MNFITENYDWIIALLLLGLILIQSYKISKLDKRIKDLENKDKKRLEKSYHCFVHTSQSTGKIRPLMDMSSLLEKHF